MAYVGNTVTTQGFIPAIDYFNGDGSTTAFILSRPVASVAQVQVVVNNVPQLPGTAFTVSGNTITFTGTPSAGTNNIYVYYTSPITQVIAPSQGTVQTAQLGNITNIASGNSSLTLQTGSGNTTALTIDTSQNVGIGTTSPTNKLHAYTASGNIYGVFQSAASSVNAGVGLIQGNNTFYHIVDAAGWQLYDGGNSATRLRVDTSGIFSCNLTQSLAGSGYTKLPNGLYIQWGGGSANTSGVTNTFPIAFPNAAYVVLAINTNQTNPPAPSCQSLTTSSFVAIVNAGGPSISYIAIGR